jgi:alpha-ribazole phosphatase
VTNWSLPIGATRLVLVRHGEPAERVRGRCYGRLDIGLSAVGRRQMQHTRRGLRGAPISAIYSSPRRRALESARMLTAGRRVVAVDDRLGEMDFGDFEGLTYDDIATRFPDTYEEWMTRPTQVAFPGGETFDAMVARVHDVLEDVRRTHAGDTVVLVSHGGVNRIALAAALDLQPCRIFRLDQAYACLNVIDYFGDEPLVRLMNSCDSRRC